MSSSSTPEESSLATESAEASSSKPAVIEETKTKETSTKDSAEGSKDGTNDAEEETDEAETEAATLAEGASTAPPAQTAWQAIFSAQHGAYYFYNSETQETTWVNPLEPPPADATPSGSAPATAADVTDSQAGSSSTDAGPSHLPRYAALQNAAMAQGIDPSLAYLDPSLLADPGDKSGMSFQAKFNARTGQFSAMDSRTPAHLSEYERAQRMSEVFFDVKAWEQSWNKDTEEEDGVGKKRKRPTKKDLERFKEQKRLKKIAKTAWLRT